MNDNETDGDAAYRVLFEMVPIAILVTDLSGSIVSKNPACDKLFGCEPKVPLVHADNLVPGLFDNETGLNGDEAPPSGQWVRRVARHEDGSEFAVVVSLSSFVAADRSLIACAILDRRGLPDHELHQLQAAALAVAASGIMITDRVGRIIWTNPAVSEITGYTREELVGKHTRILKSGVHDTEFFADLWATITRGETWSGLIVNRRKDGSHYPEEQTIAPVPGSDGEISHFIAVKRDVTEEHRARDALQRAHEELAARISVIEELNRLLEKEKLQRDNQLQLARQIQKRLLPQSPEDWPGVDLGVSSIPCFEIGGDYHDFIELPDDDLGFAVGDVSGKGIAAALIMSSAQAALRVEAPKEPDLPRLIGFLDALLFRTTPREKFATFFFARYSPGAGILRYVNAGHNPPLVCSKGNVVRLESTGPPLGILNKPAFREASIRFDIGDTLFVYTDGFTEAVNPDDREFGSKRWEALIRETAQLPVPEILRVLAETICEYENGGAPSDDKTVVVLRPKRT